MGWNTSSQIFSSIFKKFDVSRADISDYMRDYTIDTDLLKQPQRRLISSFKLENGKHLNSDNTFTQLSP